MSCYPLRLKNHFLSGIMLSCCTERSNHRLSSICSHNQISMWIQCYDKSDFFLCLEFMKCLSNLIICNSGDEGMGPRLWHSLFPNSIYTHLITAEAYHRRLMLTTVEQLIHFLLQLCT